MRRAFEPRDSPPPVRARQFDVVERLTGAAFRNTEDEAEYSAALYGSGSSRDERGAASSEEKVGHMQDSELIVPANTFIFSGQSSGFGISW